MEKRILIERWLGSYTQSIPIYDEASVSTGRQRVREVGQRLNLQTATIEKAALIASELLHNQLAHAKHGYFAVEPVEAGERPGIELIAADIGPGIPSPRVAIAGQTSSPAGLGAGLGSVCRLADEVNFDTRLEEGTCVVAKVFEKPPDLRSWELAIMSRPYPGERISGDDGVFIQTEEGLIAAVADGIGHGPEARDASNRAIELLSDKHNLKLDELALALNAELTNTRGCAMCITRFAKGDRMLECLSVGDVRAHLYYRKGATFFASIPFMLGNRQTPPKTIRIETSRVEPGSVLVMFTDGLKSRATLKGQLDILRQPAIVIAQYLLENDSRPDDDALVLVARIL